MDGFFLLDDHKKADNHFDFRLHQKINISISA
jgi:hypothetical protein